MSMRMSQAVLGGLALALVTGAVQAQEDDQSVSVNANVAQLCILGLPNPNAVDLGVIVQTSGAQAGRLTVIGDQVVQLPGSFCNYAGTVLTVDVDALLADDVNAPPAGFTRAVNYTATVTEWAPVPASATTSATASGTNPSATGVGGILNEPKQADLALTLSQFSTPANGLLIAGDYAGSVTITVGPDLSSPPVQ